MLTFRSNENFNLLNYNYQNLSNFQLICQPLFQHFPISHFFYGRIFKDGHYFLLSHDLNAINSFADYLQSPQAIFFEKFYPIGDDEIQKYLWPKDKNEMNPSLKILNSLGICHGLNVITRRSEDQSLEYFVFATQPENQKICNLYLNHFDFLERFIFYFRRKASKIIENPVLKKSAYSSFYHPEIKKLEKKDPSDKDIKFSPLSLFIDQTRIRSCSVKTADGHKAVLSERQLECLYYLTKGKTAKEIAKDLDISYRTVQTHLNLVKEKIDASSRSSVLKCLSEDLLNFLEVGFKKPPVINSWEISSGKESHIIR